MTTELKPLRILLVALVSLGALGSCDGPAGPGFDQEGVSLTLTLPGQPPTQHTGDSTAWRVVFDGPERTLFAQLYTNGGTSGPNAPARLSLFGLGGGFDASPPVTGIYRAGDGAAEGTRFFVELATSTEWFAIADSGSVEIFESDTMFVRGHLSVRMPMYMQGVATSIGTARLHGSFVAKHATRPDEQYP